MFNLIVDITMTKDNSFDSSMNKFEDQSDTYSRYNRDTAYRYQNEEDFNSNNDFCTHCYYDIHDTLGKQAKKLMKTVGIGTMVGSAIAYIGGNKVLAAKLAAVAAGSLYGYKKLCDQTLDNSDNHEHPFVIH